MAGKQGVSAAKGNRIEDQIIDRLREENQLLRENLELRQELQRQTYFPSVDALNRQIEDLEKKCRPVVRP